MSARTLQLESLESRNLMAVAAWMSGSTLVIAADPNGGVVDVRPISSTIQVQGPGGTLTFPSAGVNALQFHGSNFVDIFTNHTAIDSTIYGQGGNDLLNGGQRVDVIYGGEGHDT